MPDTVVDLGRRVKAKYPGQYDDIGDEDLGRKVKAKYPKEYADFTDTRSVSLKPTELAVPSPPSRQPGMTVNDPRTPVPAAVSGPPQDKYSAASYMGSVAEKIATPFAPLNENGVLGLPPIIKQGSDVISELLIPKVARDAMGFPPTPPEAGPFPATQALVEGMAQMPVNVANAGMTLAREVGREVAPSFFPPPTEKELAGKGGKPLFFRSPTEEEMAAAPGQMTDALFLALMGRDMKGSLPKTLRTPIGELPGAFEAWRKPNAVDALADLWEPAKKVRRTGTEAVLEDPAAGPLRVTGPQGEPSPVVDPVTGRTTMKSTPAAMPLQTGNLAPYYHEGVLPFIQQAIEEGRGLSPSDFVSKGEGIGRGLTPEAAQRLSERYGVASMESGPVEIARHAGEIAGRPISMGVRYLGKQLIPDRIATLKAALEKESAAATIPDKAASFTRLANQLEGKTTVADLYGVLADWQKRSRFKDTTGGQITADATAVGSYREAGALGRPLLYEGMEELIPKARAAGELPPNVEPGWFREAGRWQRDVIDFINQQEDLYNSLAVQNRQVILGQVASTVGKVLRGKPVRAAGNLADIMAENPSMPINMGEFNYKWGRLAESKLPSLPSRLAERYAPGGGYPGEPMVPPLPGSPQSRGITPYEPPSATPDWRMGERDYARQQAAATAGQESAAWEERAAMLDRSLHNAPFGFDPPQPFMPNVSATVPSEIDLLGRGQRNAVWGPVESRRVPMSGQALLPEGRPRGESWTFADAGRPNEGAPMVPRGETTIVPTAPGVTPRMRTPEPLRAGMRALPEGIAGIDWTLHDFGAEGGIPTPPQATITPSWPQTGLIHLAQEPATILDTTSRLRSSGRTFEMPPVPEEPAALLPQRSSGPSLGAMEQSRMLPSQEQMRTKTTPFTESMREQLRRESGKPYRSIEGPAMSNFINLTKDVKGVLKGKKR